MKKAFLTASLVVAIMNCSASSTERGPTIGGHGGVSGKCLPIDAGMESSCDAS